MWVGGMAACLSTQSWLKGACCPYSLFRETQTLPLGVHVQWGSRGLGCEHV